jgi:hypothetical protein
MTGGQVIKVANFDRWPGYRGGQLRQVARLRRWPTMTGGQVIEVANFTVFTVIFLVPRLGLGSGVFL